MIKYFIIAWFTISSPTETKYIVNTTMQFDSQHSCEFYVGLEYMPLEMGVEKYLARIHADKTTTINEISCVDGNKLIELGKIHDN